MVTIADNTVFYSNWNLPRRVELKCPHQRRWRREISKMMGMLINSIMRESFYSYTQAHTQRTGKDKGFPVHFSKLV